MPLSISRPLPPIPSSRANSLQRRSSRALPPAPLSYIPTMHLPHPSGRSRLMLFRALKQPAILALFLRTTSWPDFHSLLNVCTDLRRSLWDSQDCRDVILSHYIPGYSYALASAGGECRSEIPLTFHHFSLLMISQYIPLHVYPMHSITVLNALARAANDNTLHRASLRLSSLTLVHSHFVLFLQSLVHSGTLSPSSDLDESEDMLASPLSLRSMPQPAVRELVFPAPLSAFAADGNQSDDASAAFPKAHRSNSKYSSRSDIIGSHFSERAASLSPPRSSLPNGSRSKPNRLSTLFNKPKVPPPPPSADPHALKMYGGTWRRASLLPNKHNSVAATPVSVDEDGWLLSSDAELKTPHRRFASEGFSSDSSLSSPSSISRTNTESDGSGSSPSRERGHRRISTSTGWAVGTRSNARSGGEPFPAVPRDASPHDLGLAASRTRAPVLRVFVPCTDLDEAAVTACEKQLMRAGLWETLSDGDVVCNFGYVPPVPSASPVSSDESASAHQQGGNAAAQRQKWLMFNGYCLVPYIPPSAPPLENPLTLPTPFYFAHILPAFVDPVFIFALPQMRPPSQAASRPGGARGRPSTAPFVPAPAPQPTTAVCEPKLVHAPSRVRSPHSPSGFAVVRKYMWLARIPFVGPGSGTEAGMALGRGWHGEWVLEAEGTREGQQALVGALSGGTNGPGLRRRGQWTVVREKSGAGRLWFRLQVANVDGYIDTLVHPPEPADRISSHPAVARTEQ